MELEIVVEETEEEEDLETDPTQEDDADTFFAKNALRMVYQTNNFFLPQIRDLIERGEVLNLRPEYQRRLRWTIPQKSRLIESLLLNIPVPPIFLYESDAARYEVMDGQQRLNSVREFITNEFALTGLPVLTPLNGLRYSTCPPRIKRTLDRASLSAIVLLLESENTDTASKSLTIKDIRRFIFDRLNTGGTKLNPQEIRNALNPGVFNDILIDITRSPRFTTVFEIPAYRGTDPNDYYEDPRRQKNNLYAKMLDCQLVLRYFALRDESNIRGSMRAMLDRAMEAEITEAEGEVWKQNYQERFDFLYQLFDTRPFRLPSPQNGRERLSAAIYDASMVALDSLWNRRDEINADKQDIQRRMREATQNPSNMPIMTGQKNTANAVRDRIKLMRNILLPQ